MDNSKLFNSVLFLLEKTSTVLPDDVYESLSKALLKEQENSVAQDTLSIILESARRSRESGIPICQDTGSLFAIVKTHPSESVFFIESAIKKALRTLTEKGVLRQNCVDSITDRNTGDNTGEHVPQIHFIPWQGPTRISVMFKGGGSENVSTQYALPHSELKAGRDLDGVRKCILDAVFKAQGKGCAPGILGVCIGGDRASGLLISKEMLLHRIDTVNESPVLAKLEDTVLEQANSLEIGPMGLGGKTTLLGVRIGTAGRHPASFFVTVSYSCWATRRSTIELDDEGGIVRWL
jgi:fumarate hydratase class I